MKRLFLCLFFSLFMTASVPSLLAKTDEVMLTGISNSGVTNTVIVEEPKIEPVIIEEAVEEVAYSEPEVTYVEYVEPAPVVAAPAAGVEMSYSISIAGRTIDIVDVASTLEDSGNHVNHYDSKFYYGHNSSNVFGGIVNMGVGDTFKISRGGVTTTYRVAQTVIYEKNTSNGLLQLNGEGDYMWYVAKARIGHTKYDVSLMTCYGRSLGGGDATHRFVIFANAI